MTTTKGAVAALRLFGTIASNEAERWEVLHHASHLQAPPGLGYPRVEDQVVLPGSSSSSALTASMGGLAMSPRHPPDAPPDSQRAASDLVSAPPLEASDETSEVGASDDVADPD